MSAEPKVQCCPSNRVPALDVPKDYKRAGTEIKLGNMPAYVVGEGKKGAIIVIHDILGPRTGRHYGVCDTFAEAGYYCIMPMIFEEGCKFSDLMKEPMFNLMKKHPIGDLKPKMESVIKHLAEKKIKASATGAIGFCWGSWAVWQTSVHFKDGIASGACMHPAIIEGVFGGTIDGLAKKVNHPMLMGPCNGDPEELLVGGSVSKIFAEKDFAKDVEYIDFTKVFHGFVTQGDTSDKDMAANVKKAMDASLAFFGKTLKA